jgi:hypothetical protein
MMKVYVIVFDALGIVIKLVYVRLVDFVNVLYVFKVEMYFVTFSIVLYSVL